MKLTLYHFFPDKLNLYGDRGNIITLKMRCAWRGIELEVHEIKDCTDVDLTKADLFFIGGGPNSLQCLCTEQLFTIKDEFQAAIEDGVSALTICGGYQFLGNYYQLPNGEKLKGLSILDFYTESPSDDPKDRLISNIVVESERFGTIVGFENHGGRTYHSYETLGKVITGYGNNDTDQTEGLLYKHLIGTYLHGPILPKNPAVADFLLGAAYKRKTGNELPKLENNDLELAANKRVKELFAMNR